MNFKRIVHLTPPQLSDEQIAEKITCIRAHRERLFNTTTEISNGKLICHNYGQGGAGWTFLFGCVHESIRQFEEYLHEHPTYKNKPIAIIGAGCYGLLTATMLARKGYSVRIIAPETKAIPSYKAAGFFFPRPRKSSTPHETAVFHERGIESYRTYQQIMRGEHPFIKQGAKQVPAYFGMDIDPGFAPYIAEGLIAAPEEVTIHFGNNKIYDVMEYQLIFMDTAMLMKELERNVASLNIARIAQTITNFDDVIEPIIFNCSGFGAKELTHDPRLVPVQGHLITLKNQPIEQLQYMINVKVIMPSIKGTPRDELIYFAPKEDGILGITFIRGQDSLTANQHEFDRLLERCRTFFGD